MPNTFNYQLTNFFVSLSGVGTPPLTGREGRDFVIHDNNLFMPLSSSLLNNIGKVQTFSPNISSFYGSELPNLSAIEIGNNNVKNFTTSTRMSFLSTFNLNTPSLVVSGTNFEFIGIFLSPQLREIDLRGVTNLGFNTFRNNSNLSSIGISNTTFQGCSSIFLEGNNLAPSTIDTLLLAFSAQYGERSSLNGISLYISNPLSGTSISDTILTSFRSKGASVTNIQTSSPLVLVGQLS